MSSQNIIKLKNQSCIIKKISTEFGQISKRPHFSELDLKKSKKNIVLH